MARYYRTQAPTQHTILKHYNRWHSASHWLYSMTAVAMFQDVLQQSSPGYSPGWPQVPGDTLTATVLARSCSTVWPSVRRRKAEIPGGRFVQYGTAPCTDAFSQGRGSSAVCLCSQTPPLLSWNGLREHSDERNHCGPGCVSHCHSRQSIPSLPHPLATH